MPFILKTPIAKEETEQSFSESLSDDPHSSTPRQVRFDQDVKGGSNTSLIQQGAFSDDESSQEDPDTIEIKRLEALTAHKQHVKEFSLASGYFSSNWIAAIDNKGEKLALHDITSTHVDNDRQLHCVLTVYHGNKMQKSTVI